MFIRPTYEKKIKKLINTSVIKVITGMRRTGKTFFLQRIQEILQDEYGVEKKNICSINKEDRAFKNIVDAVSFEEYIESYFTNQKGKKYIFVDEVQEIENWEVVVRSYNGKNDEYEVFITGSNATLLSGELSTYLTGRYVEFPIYPLTFKEFMVFRNGKEGEKKKEFALFMKYGGLPGIHQFPLEADLISDYFAGVFLSVLQKDIINRYTLRNPGVIRNIFEFLSENIGSIISTQNIKNVLEQEKISLSLYTMREYLQYFQEAFLLSKVKRYDLKGKRVLELYEKYYLNDIGMRSYFLGFTNRDRGRILENIVFLELQSRGYSIYVGKQGGYEIDFVAEKNGTREYFQVTVSLENEKTRKRELRSLISNTSAFPKTVLSLDEFAEENIEGIQHKYFIDWLLEK